MIDDTNGFAPCQLGRKKPKETIFSLWKAVTKKLPPLCLKRIDSSGEMDYSEVRGKGTWNENFLEEFEPYRSSTYPSLLWFSFLPGRQKQCKGVPVSTAGTPNASQVKDDKCD